MGINSMNWRLRARRVFGTIQRGHSEEDISNVDQKTRLSNINNIHVVSMVNSHIFNIHIL